MTIISSEVYVQLYYPEVDPGLEKNDCKLWQSLYRSVPEYKIATLPNSEDEASF